QPEIFNRFLGCQVFAPRTPRSTQAAAAALPDTAPHAASGPSPMSPTPLIRAAASPRPPRVTAVAALGLSPFAPPPPPDAPRGLAQSLLSEAVHFLRTTVVDAHAPTL